MGTTTTGFDDIDANIAGLQALAAWRSAHPEIHVWRGAVSWMVSREAGATHDQILAALNEPGIERISNDTGPHGATHYHRHFPGGVDLTYCAPAPVMAVA